MREPKLFGDDDAVASELAEAGREHHRHRVGAALTDVIAELLHVAGEVVLDERRLLAALVIGSVADVVAVGLQHGPGPPPPHRRRYLSLERPEGGARPEQPRRLREGARLSRPSGRRPRDADDARGRPRRARTQRHRHLRKVSARASTLRSSSLTCPLSPISRSTSASATSAASAASAPSPARRTAS